MLSERAKVRTELMTSNVLFEFGCERNFRHPTTSVRVKLGENIARARFRHFSATTSQGIDRFCQPADICVFSSKRIVVSYASEHSLARARPVSRTMKLHFRKSNRGPGASSQLHCLYECANNGTTHFLREYILTISNRSQTCRQTLGVLRICADPVV